MVLLPSRTSGDKIIYVRHCKAEIAGEDSRNYRFLWNVENPRICYDFGCRKPNGCTCTIFPKQPLSLKRSSTQAIRINTMDIDRKYSAVQTDRITKKFGPPALLIKRDKPSNILKVFMSRRYSAVLSDEYTQEIKIKSVKCCLQRTL